MTKRFISQPLEVEFIVDANKLKEEMMSLQMRQWTSHVNSRYFSGGWSVIPLRTLSVLKNDHPILQSFQIESGSDWEDLPLLESLGEISKIVNAIKSPKKSIRLMKLDAGANIKPHRDKGLGLKFGEVRLHVPLQHSENVQFVVDNHTLQMKPLQPWYVDADLEHSVKNNGTTARINLVIDCVANDWLRALLH
ncbi:MAG: aspartyl/asparaginyl beta-hydroxylase domain-containing protein [Aestuariibacter sp.]